MSGTTDAPEADIEVDRDLVARLVASQHPDLVAPLELVANGWDNSVWRLGDDLAVRVPRRRIAAALIEKEQRWLPSLQARLAVPIPAPLRNGHATESFPWPWSIVPWFR
ncbi:phosphotransferase, partial [Rhizobium johnstonii]|uniref:phosphotransferase n=1 Tax=Rhizobium johnstonii TaxID=3019933 RepID=UPI003F9DBC81